MLFSLLTMSLLKFVQVKIIISVFSQQGSTSLILKAYQMLELHVDLSKYTSDSALNSSLLDIMVNESIYQDVGYSRDNQIFNIFSKSIENVEISLDFSKSLDDITINKVAQYISAIAFITSPSRASFGKPMQFPVILSSTTFSTFAMPYNMPSLKNELVIIDRVDKIIPIQYLKAPFDQNFWQLYDQGVSTVAINWLPFFSQCQGYGHHIYLYHLIELNKNCTLIDPENVRVVETIPTTGLNAVGDTCYLSIPCVYEEDFTREYDNKFWWQSQGEPLFYLTNYPEDIQSFYNNRNDRKSQLYSNMINDYEVNVQSDNLVPVRFITDGVFNTLIPGTFEFIIQYNQINQNEKKLVNAYVKGSNYKPQQSGSNNYELVIKFEPMNYLDLANNFQFDMPIYLVLFGVIGLVTVFGIFVFWLINRLFSKFDHPPQLRINQTFRVAFIPSIFGSLLATIPVMLYLYIVDQTLTLGLFQQINAGYDQQEITIQIARGRIGMLLLISGLVLINFGAKFMIILPSEEELKQLRQMQDKMKESKPKRPLLIQKEEEKTGSQANLLKTNTLQYQDANKTDKQEFIEPESQDYSLKHSVSILRNVSEQQIPVQRKTQHKLSIFRRATKKQEQIINSPHLSNNNESKKENDSGNLAESPIQLQSVNNLNPQESTPRHYRIDEEDENHGKAQQQQNIAENEHEEESNIIETLKYKLIHYQAVLIFTAAFLLILIGFSYMSMFYMNIFYFLLMLQIFDVLFSSFQLYLQTIYSWILSRYLLTESMLIQPILTCVEVIQFVMFMAAVSFQDFIISYLIRMSLLVIFRTYFAPILRNMQFFIRKFATWTVSKYPKTLPYLSKYIVSSIKDQHIKFYLGLHANEEFEFKEENSVEHVITMVLSFSSKMHAIFLKPFVLILIKIFEKETQIPTQYNIRYKDFDYYILFAFAIIVPQIFIDIYVLNSLELIYGYKLYDYFDYCKYRNDFCGNKSHILQLDRSLSIEHRSIDNMLFTYKFYFNVTILIYGIICIVFGITAIIQQQYPAYVDSIALPLFLFTITVLSISKSLITYIFNKIQPLSKKKEKENKIKVTYQNKIIIQQYNIDSLDEFLNPVKENLEQVMEVDLIRKNFIQLNKEWIISNLDLFINSEHFQENDEYLLKTYELLQNEEKREDKEKKRQEMLAKKQKEKELKQKKKYLLDYLKYKSKITKTTTTEDEPQTDKTYQKQESVGPNADPDLPISTYLSKNQQTHTTQGQEETIIRLRRMQAEGLKKMLFIWFYQGKQNLYLKSLVSEILEKNQEEHCKRCGLDIELRVVEQIPFAKVSNQFKFRTLGKPYNKHEWKCFYENNQKFITLCLDCEIGYRNKMQQRQNRKNSSVPIVHIENKEPQKNTGLSKAIVMKWLFMARSNLLFKVRTTEMDRY